MSNKKEIPIHAIIALRKGEKAKETKALTALHRQAGNAGWYNGITKEYTPTNEGDIVYQEPGRKVQLHWKDVLSELVEIDTPLLNLELSLEESNCIAKADIQVGATVIAKDVPVTTLLFLEKHLIHYRTLITNMPVLAEDKDWDMDINSGLYKTRPVQTVKTKKYEEEVVVIQPTKEHPGQWTTKTKDIIEGMWETTHLSGAMPVPERKIHLKRVNALLDAVKTARAKANSQMAVEKDLATNIFAYLFPSVS